MLEEQIKTVSKYIKKKYPGRYTLKLNQVATELKMDKKRVKELKDSRVLSSLSIKSIATFIVNNPPKLVKTDMMERS